jgi:hypothetical protein
MVSRRCVSVMRVGSKTAMTTRVMTRAVCGEDGGAAEERGTTHGGSTEPRNRDSENWRRWSECEWVGDCDDDDATNDTDGGW